MRILIKRNFLILYFAFVIACVLINADLNGLPLLLNERTRKVQTDRLIVVNVRGTSLTRLTVRWNYPEENYSVSPRFVVLSATVKHLLRLRAALDNLQKSREYRTCASHVTD